MKTRFKCGHIFDDGVADGKTQTDKFRDCLECVQVDIKEKELQGFDVADQWSD